jgi:DNA-binding CsgD family transcriptional regulator
MADLTDRELQLLELVALGSTNTSIARKLGISPRTVAHHLDSAYRKLDVSGRAAAVYRAVTEGMVTPRPADPDDPLRPGEVSAKRLGRTAGLAVMHRGIAHRRSRQGVDDLQAPGGVSLGPPG